MSASAINLLNQGSLPPSIAGGVPALPPAVGQDPRVQQAQAQATQANAAQDDIAKRKAAEMAPINSDIEQKNQGLSAMAEKGPDQVPLPQNNAKHIDPKQLSDSYSAFMTLGALAGLLSKTPMTAALNNMTAAINGVTAGDKEQYDRSYQEFQQNYQKAVDTNKAKLEEYNRIFANSKASLDEKIREAGMVANKYGDELVRAEARNQNYKGIQQAIDSSMKSMEHAADKKQELDHWHAEMSQQQQFHKDQMGMEATRLAEQKKEHETSQHTGTLGYKLDELEKLKASGGVTQQEYDDRRRGLIEGQAKTTVSEEKTFQQALIAKTAASKIDELQSKGVQMPAVADLKDGNGIIDSAEKLSFRRALSDEEQQLLVAARQYAEASGHLVSGARLPQQSYYRILSEYAPMNGEPEGTRAFKKQLRDIEVRGATVGSGKLGSQIDKTISPGVSSDASESKTIGGVTYHKVNGQWLQQ